MNSRSNRVSFLGLSFMVLLVIGIFTSCNTLPPMTQTDAAADEICDCMRPIAQKMENAQNKKISDQKLGDIFKMIGEGINVVGEFVSCSKDIEEKYIPDHTEEQKDTFIEEVGERAKQRCPKIVETMENFDMEF